jgi:hypothetical protein
MCSFVNSKDYFTTYYDVALTGLRFEILLINYHTIAALQLIQKSRRDEIMVVNINALSAPL